MSDLPAPMAPIFSADDFLRSFLAALPQGDAWPRDAASTQVQALATLQPQFARLAARANVLLYDLFPANTEMLLPEWEESVGLPDPCAGEAPTVAQRRGQMVARFVTRGGPLQSAASLEAFLALLGFDATITATTAPFRCGFSGCGDGLGDAAWYFLYTVSSSFFSFTSFECGLSTCGDPVGTGPILNSVVQCAVTEGQPAHTVVNFRFSTKDVFNARGWLAAIGV